MVETSAWMFHHNLWQVFGKFKAKKKKKKNSGASCLLERCLMERLTRSFWLNSRCIVLRCSQFHTADFSSCNMLHGFSEEQKKKKKTSSQIYKIQFVSLASSLATQEAAQRRRKTSNSGPIIEQTITSSSSLQKKKNQATGLLYTRWPTLV